jgi:hypothetical protein
LQSYRYIGPDERYYPTLGVTALPGQLIDLPGDAPADGRWVDVLPGGASVTVDKLPEAVPAPADPTVPAPAVAVAGAIPAEPVAAPEVAN